ncbi:MAG: MBL fold metallo-hydrolase [Clostridia bacterium]|nr:MBL fold metallo-hydrolase [Clostridia bacterium]
MSCTENDQTLWQGEKFTVDVLETGKSDAILIRADGTVILFDTADTDDGAAIVSFLRNYGITKIDWLILTHYDNDHVGGAPAVIRSFSVGRVVGPDYDRDSSRMRNLSAALAETGLKLEKLTDDVRFETLGGEVWINTTRKTFDLSDESEENNMSLIVSVTSDGHRFLFLGDALKARITEYCDLDGALSACDFVKLPHHGDWNKGLGLLLEETEPSVAVVCADRKEAVEEKLFDECGSLGTVVYGTWDGGIHISVDGDGKLSLCRISA